MEAIPPLAELFALAEALAVFPTQAPVVVALAEVFVVLVELAPAFPVRATMVGFVILHGNTAVGAEALGLMGELAL
jgi:hypothetical protein